MSANALQNISRIDDSLWEAADQLRADTKLTRNDYDNFIGRRARAIALGLNVKLMSMTPAQAAEAETAG